MPRAHILLHLLIGVITSAPAAIKIFGLKRFFVGVGVVAAGLALLALHRAIRHAADRHADRRTVRRLLAQKRGWSRRDWPLPAPESYMLLQNVRRASREAFKLGLLQLVAAGVLRPDKRRIDTSGTRGDESMLRPGPRSKEAVTGSVASIYTLWAASLQPTIKDLARRAKQATARWMVLGSTQSSRSW